jgi:type II restriction/modification system DNA methylase subunit YeeA
VAAVTPQDFIAKWKNVELTERAASQSHFIDLCRMLDEPSPTDADPTGEWYTFEKGALKTGGGDGWADVWKRGHFAWEYKRRNSNLDAAYVQLQRYAVALEQPPLLIVADTQRIRIHSKWTNTVQQTTELMLDELVDERRRRVLKWAFAEPDQLKPGKTRQQLTEEAAVKFASLAQKLRERGHDPHVVAHFVNRMVFCMFAEDVTLLPRAMFRRMLEESQGDPAAFVDNAQALFGAMREGGRVGFERVEWFNGGIFDDDTVLPLQKDDLKEALAAAQLDWSNIDPSIMGTLFERGLDPGKRSQLGAHYTNAEKIELIVRPVIIEPLTAEWNTIKEKIVRLMERTRSHRDKAQQTRAFNDAQKLHRDFIERLKTFRVLDPACGSGNFLHVAPWL